MKKLLFLILLFAGTLNAQIISITDTNFKSKLLQSNITNQIAYGNGGYIKIDSNNDNEIQFSEATVIDSLNIDYSNIVDMTGIEAFTNLKKLNCSNNQIVTLNLTSNITLQQLFCQYNQIATLNISTLSQLQLLNCSNNQLTSLDVTNCTNLAILGCATNQINSLNVNTLANLINLDASNNNLTSMNISNLNNITTISLSDNELTSFTVNNLNALTHLGIYNNQISSLDLSSLPNLNHLYCYFNNLNSINLGSISNISFFNCSNNLLTNLNLSNLNQLTTFYCSNNSFTSLDFTSNTNLNNLTIDNCPNLETLFAKNGANESISFSNCPNLSFICADESQIQDVIESAISFGYTNCTVNTYCSFTPGGDFNTLTGIATFDINNNGCDASDIPFGLLGLNVSLNGVSTNSSVFTNNAGIYNLFTSEEGVYQLNPNLENPTYYNVSPVVQDFPVIDNSSVTQNFCITANGVHPDLEIVIAPITPARPGFDAQYQIVYKNKGNQTLSGSFNFNYDDTKLDFVTSTVVPFSSTTGILIWDYTNLLPFENRTVYVTLNVNSPVEIPAVNIGDTFTFSSTINPITGDETPSDNTFTYAQTVVGSYDPNNITCMEGQTVSPSEIGEFLHYIVNFENTGNYYAENVVVKIEIDETKYDVNSLQLLNTSHLSNIKRVENKVEFIFQNINLAAAAGNPPVGGHGNVLFKIKSKSNLESGDMVSKSAKIYFDYNAPIDTNIAETIYAALSNPITTPDNTISLYPNPTSSIITINCKNTITSIEIYDVQGRILETSLTNETSTKIDLTSKQNGIYFVKITSDKGSKVEKVVKN